MSIPDRLKVESAPPQKSKTYLFRVMVPVSTVLKWVRRILTGR